MSPSREVQEAVGVEGESLEARRDHLRQIVATPSEVSVAARELLEVETQIAERDRAALTAAAEQRLVGITRAIGSLVASSEQDDERVLAAAKAFAAAMEQLDARFVKYVKMRDEATRVAAAFGLPVPKMLTMPLPRSRPLVDEARQLAAGVPLRGTGHGCGLDDGLDEFGQTDGGQLVARRRR